MKNLSSRERILIFVLGSVGIGALIYTFIIAPAFEPKSGGKTSAGGASQVRSMERLSDEYKKIRAEKSRLQGLLDNKNENTASLIQQWASTAGIEKNIGYTKRSQSNVQNKYTRVTTDVKIEGVAFQPLMKFLADVENSNELIRLQYIRITKALKGTDTYDVLLKIDNFTSNR